MGYACIANNKEIETFVMGAFLWPHLLEQCGSYFTCITRGARWYTVFDERMSTHFHHDDDDEVRKPVVDRQYPAIICNCGFEVTEEEARVMARIARNYVAIQETLKEPTEEELNAPITTPDYLRPFPLYVRRDWVERYKQFAEWAEQSQGFKIY
jgi:hypothetical protein